MPKELQKCSDVTWNVILQRQVIFNFYNSISESSRAAAISSRRYKTNTCQNKKKKWVIGWNSHVREAHRKAKE